MPKKFSKEQRLAIGQQIYNDEITVNEAASRYDISPYTARDYMRFFRDANHLAPKSSRPWVRKEPPAKEGIILRDDNAYANMSREELLEEICRLRINEERLNEKGLSIRKNRKSFLVFIRSYYFTAPFCHTSYAEGENPPYGADF